MPDPAVFSLELKWQGVTSRGSFTDVGKLFTMDFARTGAHISWQGKNKKTGAEFHTTAGAQTVNFAQISDQRSGVFFNDDEDHDDD